MNQTQKLGFVKPSVPEIPGRRKDYCSFRCVRECHISTDRSQAGLAVNSLTRKKTGTQTHTVRQKIKETFETSDHDGDDGA